MAAPLVLLVALRHCFVTAMIVFLDFGRLVASGVRSRRALGAENLFLRKQLALFQERKVKPRMADDATRWTMATLSRMFPWHDVLWNVKPDTLIRWHRKGFRLFWRWKSRSTGRPRLPKDLRQLIREMAAGNVTWGEERITNELKLKLGMRLPLFEAALQAPSSRCVRTSAGSPIHEEMEVRVEAFSSPRLKRKLDGIGMPLRSFHPLKNPLRMRRIAVETR